MKRRRSRFTAMLAFVLAVTIFLLPLQTLAWEDSEIETDAPEMQTDTVEIEDPSTQEELPEQAELIVSEETEAETEAESEPNVRGAERSVTHNHNGVAFTPWDSTTSLPPDAGNYYLTADVTIASRWDVPAGITNLCLNGHGIIRTNASGTSGSVIQVGSGAVLNLYDCDTTTVHHYSIENPSANGAGLGVLNDGGAYSFIGGYITGGVISGAADGNHLIGGGVNVVSGSFTMNGGTIFGNKVCINGGGVKVKGAGASFTMNGGAILANYNDCYGGAISVGDNGSGRLCTLTINGGTIARNWSGRNGGAIHLDSYNHTFILTGGRIVNNYTNGNYDNGSIGRAGGGILKDGTSLKLSGNPVIKDNFNGGNQPNDLYLRSDKTDILTLSGLTSGADVCVTFRSLNASNDIKVATGAQKADLPYIRYSSAEEGAIVYCDGEKDWVFDNGEYAILVGAHHTHEAGTVWASVPPAACVTNNGTTTAYTAFADALNDWTVGSTLKLMADVTTSSTINAVGGAKTLDLNGYEIKRTGGTGDNDGIAIMVKDAGNLTVTGPGRVTGGYGWHCGGIHVANNCTLVLDNCEISGNAGHYGGGLYSGGGTVTLRNGTVVQGNTASDGFGGSGIYVENRGTLLLEDATFTGNEIRDNGKYAVFLCGNAKLQVSGAPVIYDNTYNGAQKNLFLYQSADQDSKVQLIGSLTEGTHIGVGQVNVTGMFTSGWKDNMGSADPAKYFTSDNGSYQIYLNGSGEASIGTPPAASVISGDTATSYAAFSDAVNAWTAGSTLKLLTDVATSSTIVVPSGEHILDLNGYALKAASAGYCVVTVGSGASLTIDDSSDSIGKITGGSVGQNYGGGVTVDGGTLTLRGGAITGNANTNGGIGNCGGGVHVRNSGKFYMEGGEISGNTSYVGGGVCTDTSATTVSITGGVIKNNRTDRFGSAVWAGRNSAAIFRIGGSAQIIDNISTWTGDKDGEGTLNTGYTYLLSGDPTVHGDWKTNGTSSRNTHINLDNDGSSIQRIELEGALTNSTGTPKLTVTPLYRWDDLANGQTFLFTNNWSVYMGAAHPADYFKVDDGVTGIRVIRKDGEAALTGSSELGDLYITFEANGGEGAMEPQLTTTPSAVLNQNTYTREGFDFIGWNTAADGSGTDYDDAAAVTLTGDLTLYAQWEEAVNLLEGEGTEEQPYLIQSADDWDALSAYINCGGRKYRGKHFRLTQNISVTTALGNRPNTATDSEDNVFSGVFDGGGHTLNVNIDDPVFAAPFAVAHNATIRNLHVTGSTHSSANHASGLVAASKGRSIYDTSSLTIQNVTVSVDVSCNSHVAGIVGHAHSANITMENVVFDGSISASSVQGGMIGWGGLGNGAKFNASFKDCLFIGTYNKNAAFYPVAFANGQGTTTLINDFYTTSLGSGGSPITPTGEGQVKLLAVTVEKDGKVRYFDSIVTASSSENWTAGSTLKLMSDVTTGSTVTVPSGEHILDLNGYGIRMTGSGSVLNVGSSSTMIVNDSNPEAEHRFTVSNAKSNGAGLATVNDSLTSGYKTFTGGYLTGGSAQKGGGILVQSNGSLILNGGVIIGNQSSFMGGGIKIDGGSTYQEDRFIMNGGAVMYNTVSGWGAGICSDDSVKMTGGTVSYNCATNNPGGIHCHYLYLSGGCIEYNFAGASDYASGAHADHEVFISGAPVIANNVVNGVASNLDWDRTEYQHGHKINLTGALTEGAMLSVTMRVDGVGVLTSGWNTYMGSADPAKYFASDNADYEVRLENGEAILNYPFVSGVSAEGFSGDYDGKTHAVTVTVPEGVTVKYGTTEGDYTLSECPAYTDAGTYTVYYQVSQDKHLPVAGSATVQIAPINATVTITGKVVSADYDGEVHTASGYDAVADTALYDVTKDFTFSGNAKAVRTNAGTAEMGLAAEQFSNTNANFATVTFLVTDGYVTVSPIDVTVTITGHNDTVDYDGEVHTVSGYDAVADTALYDVTSFFTFNASAKAVRTNAGTATMGLTAEQFANTNSNFAAVTFVVTDGYVTVNPIAVTVTITGHNDTVDYNGGVHIVTGYDAEIGNALYKADYFSFSGDATATRTDRGRTEMGLSAEQFTNLNSNFAPVTFNVTDGYISILPIDVTVTIIGSSSTVDYDGTEHAVSGYTATADNELYDVNSDFTFSSDATAALTDAGTATMGLTAEQFTNTNENFGVVVFVVTDGFVTVNPIDITVTITGHSSTADYDGTLHSVSGYDAVADTVLYNVSSDISFSGSATATQTDVGTANMGLAATQFSNINANFATVIFNVTDGYVTVNPIDVTVTITGHSSTVDYDGALHSVSGYDAVASTDLYDVTKDFVFSGDAAATQTDAGTAAMGLAAEQFANTNPNFAEVTFTVTDGYVTVNPIDVTVTITGHSSTVDYDGKAHSVSGYEAAADTALYDVNSDFTFSGDAAATQTDAGTATMGLTAEQFSNTNANFATVTFLVTDGCITVIPIDVTVVITGHNDTVDYDGQAHTVTGYDVMIENTLYKETDFTFSGNATATQTAAGTAGMGLAAEQFSNENMNFATVTFNVTDGYITILPINVTVTIVGSSNTADYDGTEHAVSGYTATADNELYNVNSDFTFSGDATAAQTDAGTATMGLTAAQFANTNPNFATVTFHVTDGYVTVEPIDVTVTITGHTGTAAYDGQAHTVSGYDAVADTALYDVTKDFTFSGSATATRTDAGAAIMGLTASQFSNINPNFAEATFVVTDGYVTVTTVDAVITSAPVSAEPIYDGTMKELVVPGVAEGGTLCYALGADPSNAPDADRFDPVIPAAKDVGSYYVWFEVVADSNHNDVAPACVKVVLADASWVTLNGTLYESDGETPLAGAVVTLMTGDQTVDYVITDSNGNYQFTVPAGVYSVVVEDGVNSSTTIAKVFENTVQDFKASDGKTESLVMVTNNGSEEFGIAVGGLAEEADAIRANQEIAADDTVSLVMTVELKTNNNARYGAFFLELLQIKSFIFFDVKIEQTIGSETTVVDATTNVLEIAVPYEKTGRRDLTVYSSDGTSIRYFRASDSREAGTFRIDRANGYVYIYADSFATFAIGYTPHYRVRSAMTLGSYKGSVNVVIKSNLDGSVYRLENVVLDQVRFTDIPKGLYTMTVTWEDGVTNTLTMPLTVS